MKKRERAVVSISLAWNTPNCETHHFYFNRISMQFIELKNELYQSYKSEHPFLKISLSGNNMEICLFPLESSVKAMIRSLML